MIKERVKNLGYERYKLVVQVTVGEKTGQGIRLASRCLWDTVGRCRLTVWKPVFKAPMLSALETMIWVKWFQLLLSNSTCAATTRRRTTSRRTFTRTPASSASPWCLGCTLSKR